LRGRNVVGVVLNAMQESHSYHAGYYYGYDYGEGKETNG
jgi:hypothetical protein